MLLQFSVSNSGSIREEQTLSLLADADTSLPGNAIDLGLPGMKDQRVLKGAVQSRVKTPAATNPVGMIVAIVATTATAIRGHQCWAWAIMCRISSCAALHFPPPRQMNRKMPRQKAPKARRFRLQCDFAKGGLSAPFPIPPPVG